MFSLFWRLFLGFWVSLVLLGISGTWLSENIRDNEQAVQLNSIQFLFLKKFRKQIKFRDSKKLIHHWKNNPPRKPIKKIWMTDRNGKPLYDTKLDGSVEKLWSQTNGRAMLIRQWRDLWIGPIKVSDQGDGLWVVLQTENVPMLDSRHWTSHPFTRILLLLIASIVSAFLVSLFLVRPIKKLQKAVQELKTDLSARVEPSITSRKDELGKLGLHINSMAETIESLVNSQQHILWDVSHELRSPLARIQTALAIAEQKSEPEKAISRLNKEVTLLNKMISQLLLLGRLQAGLQALQHEPVHLKNLLSQIIDDMHYENEAPFSVKLNLDEDSQVSGDPLLLASLFGNLLRNAREHNQQGVEIEIEAHCDTEKCCIYIRDNGIGISRIMEEQLFAPFKRESRNTQGLGLGMAITKNIVELHKGSIEVKNLTQGVEVKVSLPINPI